MKRWNADSKIPHFPNTGTLMLGSNARHHFPVLPCAQDQEKSTLIVTTLCLVLFSVLLMGAVTKPLMDWLLDETPPENKKTWLEMVPFAKRLWPNKCVAMRAAYAWCMH